MHFRFKRYLFWHYRAPRARWESHPHDIMPSILDVRQLSVVNWRSAKIVGYLCEVYHFAPLCLVHFPEIRGFAACTCIEHAQCSTTFHVMHHREALFELHQCTKFRVAPSKFPELKVPMHVRSARVMHVHYAPNRQMQCTIELHTMNPIGVPNFVSVAQNFLEPKDPSRITFFGPGGAACTPQERQPEKHTDKGSIRMTCKFGTGDALRLACRGGKRTKGNR